MNNTPNTPSQSVLNNNNFQENYLPLNNVFTENYNGTPIVNQKTPVDNPLAGPFNVSEYSDYSGNPMGEYYHIMQYMQESMAEITKVHVPYLGFDGSAVPQHLASKDVTGNTPVFDVLAESYGWMAISPEYQKYIQKHIWGDHGGIHDVITPRGFDPKDFLAGGELFANPSLEEFEVYKTPQFNPVTLTDPRLNVFR